MKDRNPNERTHRIRRVLIGASCLLGALLPTGVAGQRAESETDGEVRPARLPLAFIENRGQWPEEICFRLGRGALAAAVLEDGFALNLSEVQGGRRGTRAVGLAFRFVGDQEKGRPGISDGAGSRRTGVHGVDPTPGRYHFMIGDDPRQWRSNVRGWNRVRYPDVWPGIEVLLRDGAGLFEYDLKLAPGADLAGAEMRVEGAGGLSIDGQGRLVVETELGPLVHTAPVAWTVNSRGERQSHPCRFRQVSSDRFGFQADPVPEGERLVVDPGVVWSTFLGDEDEDLTRSVVRAPGGDVITTGGTYSYDFPMVIGSYDVTLNGNLDAFITRISAAGDALVYSTFLGGSSADHGTALALHADGSVYVGGEAFSADLPTTPGAFRLSPTGLMDGFVAHLDATGAHLLACTYFGSSGNERVLDMLVDGNGRPVLVGSTPQSDFPTVQGSFSVGYGGGSTDGYLSRFSTDLTTLEASTFLGAEGSDAAQCVGLTAGGHLVVGGDTRSPSFPVTSGALQGNLTGGPGDQDGFLLALDGDAQTLQWSTYFGGSADDGILSLGLNGTGICAVGGRTESSDFPLGANPDQGVHGGLSDAFLAFLQPSGSATQLLDSTYYGGSGDEGAEGLAWLSTGQVVVAGTTTTTDLPMEPWVFDDDFGKWPHSGTRDLFLCRYEPDGSLSYSTYFGGEADEFFSDMVDGGEGTVVFGGYTNSYNLPVTPGSFDIGYDYTGIYDGFASRFEFLRFPFSYGNAKVHSAGGFASLSIGGFPSHSLANLEIWVDGVLANSTGLFFHSSNPGVLPFAGGELLMSPPYQRTAPQTVGWLGNGSLSVTIDPTMIGTTRYYQYWFADPGDAHGVGLSNGMEIFFYP